VAVGGAFALAMAHAAALETEARQLSVALRAVGRDGDLATASLQGYIVTLQHAGVARDAAAAIVQGLADFRAVTGRSRAMAVQVDGRDITLIDDAYNANPDSVRAAIDVLASLPGPHLLVLGDMGEVGARGPQFHAEVGGHARARGIEYLHTLGEQSRAMGGVHHSDIDTLNAAVLAALPSVGSVLVKGSRFMRMERVVDAIARRGSRVAREDLHAH